MVTRRFSVLGLPAPQGSKKHVGGGRTSRRHGFTRFDDKLQRAVGDALTRLAWRDDSQIVAWHAYKHYATSEHPVGATITIQELRRC